MNDMALSPVPDEATAVALAYELLRSDATGQARAETLEQIALILETLPSPQVADSRVQLFCECLDSNSRRLMGQLECSPYYPTGESSVAPRGRIARGAAGAALV